MIHPTDRPKVDGVHGFKDSEATHTPLAENVKSHAEKLAQNTATIQAKLENAPQIVNYPPPGGRDAVDGGHYKPSTTLNTSMQYSREGNRTYSGADTKGRILIAGNHPNKNLAKHYG